MAFNREILRRKAKKVYKENTKNIPKGKRIPFAEFFKKYCKMKNTDQVPEVEAVEPEEDFDFEDMVNINDINNEDDLEDAGEEEDLSEE